MRTILTTGTDDFTIIDRAAPEPRSGEVRIRVAAASVNPVDVGAAHGVFHRMGVIPTGAAVGLGWDVSGVVDAVGPDVTGLTTGTAVAGLRHGIGPDIGTYGEAVVLPATAVARLPRGLDPADAAAVPLIALTASQAIDLLNPGGRRLLIVGASGGVGGYAVPLAAQRGATVTAVGKRGDVENLIHHGAGTVVTDAAELTDRRFDAVFDPAGAGAGLLDLIVDGGRYLGTAPRNAPAPVRGITSGWIEVRADGAELAGLLTEVAAGRLPLRIAGDFALDEAAKAHQAFEDKSIPGRWLLRI
ncbi:UNVERIFIED_CONTAM: NADPH:quinone reductase-like Zn-dependent oxidoreductase [Williamsia faeni]